mgnify:CR=1 FL=1
MIGKSVTIIRTKAYRDALARPVREVYTIKGSVVDVNHDNGGGVSGVRVHGGRVETGEYRNAWYALGPAGLSGSMLREESATVDACGHRIIECAC